MTASFTAEIDLAYGRKFLTDEEEQERDRRERAAKSVASLEIQCVLHDIEKSTAEEIAERLAAIAERLADWES